MLTGIDTREGLGRALQPRGLGTTVSLRPLATRSSELLTDFLQALSPASRRARFGWASTGVPDALLGILTAVDAHSSGAWIAVADEHPGRAVGEVRYTITACEEAELAVSVVDAWQGRGLGGALCAYAIEMGLRRGVRRFVASSSAGNSRVRALAARMGFGVRFDARDPALLRFERSYA